jgi:hypothetical protein
VNCVRVSVPRTTHIAQGTNELDRVNGLRVLLRVSSKEHDRKVYDS